MNCQDNSSLCFLRIYSSFSIKKSVDKIFARGSHAQNVDPITFIQLQTNIITIGFERAVSSGNWNLKRFKMNKSGVSEVVSRLSHSSSVGVITRVVSQFERSRKVSGPRALHTSSCGYLWPIDTPEAKQLGFQKIWHFFPK